MNNTINNAVPEKRKKSNISWIIPIIALLATSWLIYKSISEAGVDLVVNFKSGNGFKAGKTMVIYKGYNLGKVTKITVGKDLKSVNAHIRINKDTASFIAKKGTDFWIVRPKFSVSEISGLDTIISGVYIEVRPATIEPDKLSKLPKWINFNGHDEKPLKYHNEDGTNITLIAKNLSGISVGTPIFHKKFNVGSVIATKLLKDQVKIFINIQKEYESLINQSSVFWNVSGVNIDASLNGVNIQMDSMTSLLSGGIAFKTPKVNADKIVGNKEFLLHANNKEAEQNQSMVKLLFDNAKGLQAGKTSIIYKGIEIGKIMLIELIDDNIIATAILDEKFKKFNTTGTKYHKVDAVINTFGLKNVDTILNGVYINIIPGKGEYIDKFNVFNSADEASDETMTHIILKSDKFKNLQVDSKIYYKNIVIGSIRKHNFTKDLENIIIYADIKSKYNHLINDKTLFYNISTPVVEAKNFNLKVNFEGFEPLVNGGIGLEYTKSNNKIKPKRFWLYSSYIELLDIKQKYSKGKRIQIQVGDKITLKKDMPIIYKKEHIGFVESIDYDNSDSFATLFINSKYEKYIKSFSKFYKQSAVEMKADFGNVEFKIDSIETLIKGGIVLTNDFKIQESNILKKYTYKIYNSFDELPIKKYNINLNFNNVDGLDSHDVKLIYKGITVGKIVDIHLNDTLSGLNAQAYLYENFKSLAVDSSIFYIVKPNISFSGITGLNTIIKGSYINIVKGEGTLKSTFSVYENKPDSSKLQKGLRIMLHAKNSGSLSNSSSVYYKKIKVGEIEDIDLNNNSKFVNIKIFIYDKYKNLVRENSEFYNVSGIDMDISLVGGAKIKADSLNTVILGGISFSTPNEFGAKVKNEHLYTLHDNIKEEWINYNPEIILE